VEEPFPVAETVMIAWPVASVEVVTVAPEPARMESVEVVMPLKVMDEPPEPVPQGFEAVLTRLLLESCKQGVPAPLRPVIKRFWTMVDVGAAIAIWAIYRPTSAPVIMRSFFIIGSI